MTGAGDGADDTARLAAEVDAPGALFGARRRRRAARRLAALRTPAAVRALAAAYAASPDRTVVETAGDRLARLDGRAEVDALCEAVFGSGSARLAHLVVSAGYRHSDPARHALLLFLTGRFEEYAELDFDGGALAAARAAADEPLRARLAARARESERTDWVRAVVGTGGRATVAELSEAEWDAAIGTLLAAGEPARLWRLALQAPPFWSVRILSELHGHQWRPDAAPERVRRYRELTARARRCAGNPAEGYGDAVVLPGCAGEVTRLVTTPDGALLATAGHGGGVCLWRLPTGEPVRRLADGRWFDLAVFPGGDLLAGSRIGETAVWRLPSGEQVGTVRTSQREPWSSMLLVTPDGELLIDSGLTAAWWRPPWGPKADRADDRAVYHAMMSRSGGRFVVGGRTRLPPGIENDTVAMTGNGTAPHGAVAIPGTPLVATGGDDGDIRLWQAGAPRAAGVLAGHTGRATHLAVTADGTLLVSGGADRTVRLWRMPAGDPAGVVTGLRKRVTALVLSAAGDAVAAGDASGAVRLWRLPAGGPPGEFAAFRSGHERAVTGLAFTPDGGSLVSGDRRGGLRLRHLWHPELTALCRLPLRDLHPGRVEALRRRARSAPERPWVDVISALVRWRHRDDIEVAGPGRTPDTTDIEVDGA
ncbi:WD40 repeat domain-containing protein [Streptomyces sp. MAR4 CNX-425]|uniref:WD40 repeat domain-containing protein n=1 Tax=Streptomyces sp. MAR4 CNX-425 TaxID=3406343 RepID=UPI003B506B94